MYVFNIFNIDQHRYLNHDEYVKVTEFLELKTVPVVGEVTLTGITVDDLVKMSDKRSVLNLETKREGIVLRPYVEETDPELGRLSFKVINTKFLLKYNDD